MAVGLSQTSPIPRSPDGDNKTLNCFPYLTNTFIDRDKFFPICWNHISVAIASAGSISSVLSIFIDREKFTSRCLATLLDFLRSSALQNKLSCKKSKHSNIDV